eukprot:jgi/Bigna1/88016/estExt_fgenesh1_pg.C_270064
MGTSNSRKASNSGNFFPATGHFITIATGNPKDEYSIRKFKSLEEASLHYKTLKKKKIFRALVGPDGRVLKKKVRSKRHLASFKEHCIGFMRRRASVGQPRHGKALYSVAKKRSRHPTNEFKCSPPVSTPSSIHEPSSSHESRVPAMTVVDVASGKPATPASSRIVKSRNSFSDKPHHSNENPLFDTENIK